MLDVPPHPSKDSLKWPLTSTSPWFAQSPTAARRSRSRIARSSAGSSRPACARAASGSAAPRSPPPTPPRPRSAKDSAVYPANTHVIRLATEEDAATLTRLAHVDSQRPLGTDVLIGEVDGKTAAAISLTDG